MIRLFTTIYREENAERRDEFRKCLELNLACEFIEEICLLSEGGEEILPDSSKFHIRRVKSRPTYENYFAWIAEVASADDVSIIANTDIFFNEQLALFSHWNMPRKTLFALSRWDQLGVLGCKLCDRNDSQDAWIFRGKPRGVYGAFQVGVPRCDNRIAAEFEKAGYTALNPSFSLRCFHIHNGPPRPYLDVCKLTEIPPPYKYVWPHNLFGFFGTILYNIKYPHGRMLWRFDNRKFFRWVLVRALLKISRSVRTRS